MDTGPITETGKAWYVELLLNSDPIKFKVDTGAAVTAIPAEMSRMFPDVIPSQRILRGAGNYKLKIAG